MERMISKDNKLKVNGVHAWFLAARPKTLTGAAVPVVVGITMAFCDICQASTFPLTWHFNYLPALLCLLFAFIMQIDANFINDFFDCVKGTDRDDRLGPKRACAQGWISLGAMKQGIALTTVLGIAVGLPLIIWGGWWMLLVGLLCVLFAFLYTTKLSYLGLGDVLVLIFFGLVPVCITYFIQLYPRTLVSGASALNWQVAIASLAVGLVTDNLLIVNNFRDRDQDHQSGKNTLIVRFGAQWGARLYLIIGIAAVLLCVPFAFHGRLWATLLPCLYLIPHLITWRKMMRIWQGRELNQVLGATARNILIFGVLLSVGIVLV